MSGGADTATVHGDKTPSGPFRCCDPAAAVGAPRRPVLLGRRLRRAPWIGGLPPTCSAREVSGGELGVRIPWSSERCRGMDPRGGTPGHARSEVT